MNDLFRRIVSTAVATLVALSTVLICAPEPVAAAEGHCKPSVSMKAGCTHCPQKDVMDCCATSAPQPASVPQDGQTQSGPAGAASTVVPAWGAAIAAILHVPGLARALREAPPHGYRSTDLPLLNATFLI